MRVNQYNQNNYSQWINLFQQFQNLGKNKGGSSSKQDMVEVAPGYFCQNDPKIIANFKKNFDKDGDLINSHGVAGLDITNKDPSEWHQIIELSEDGKQKLFDMVKSEFIENNGIENGDTTQRSEVYTAYYKTIPKADRLKAGWSMGQLEHEYYDGLVAAVKEDNPDWKIGDKFDSSILDKITRETLNGIVEQQTRKGFDTIV